MFHRARRLLLLAVLSCPLLSFAPALAQTVNDRSFPNGPNPNAVATFHSIGLYWYLPGLPANSTAQVSFKVQGSAEAAKPGLDLWYDTRNGEFRGSLVQLLPGTKYDITITGGGASVALTGVNAPSTWSESFDPPADPAYSISVPASGISQINIGTGAVTAPQSQTAGGVMTVTVPNANQQYVLITGQSSSSRSVVTGASANCINVNGAAKVVIRSLKLLNCGQSGIFLRSGASDIVIDDNEMTGWGRWGTDRWSATVTLTHYPSTDGAIHCNAAGNKIIVQRNIIHDPRWSATYWDQSQITQPDGSSASAEPAIGGHPIGPQGLVFQGCGSNHVVRYNDILGTQDPNVPEAQKKYFNDSMGDFANFTLRGFPWADSDIYANRISHTYDDGIESEGGNRNVRIWANYLDRTMVAIANGAVVSGPIYVWRNVSNDMALLHNPNATDEGVSSRGPFVKAGSNSSDSNMNGGRAYYFHNTTLQPPSQQSQPAPRGAGEGPNDSAGSLPFFNFVSLNNIWHIHRPLDAPGPDYRSIRADCNVKSPCTADFDLFNGLMANASNPGAPEIHGWGSPSGSADINSVPRYATSGGAYPASSAVPSEANGWSGDFTLAAGSLGQGQGVRINNFNDMDGADPGAHQSGTPPMKFGRAAATPPQGGGGGGGSTQPPVLDDFEDGDAAGWTPDGVSSWAVVQGTSSKVFRQSDTSAGARASLDASSGFTDQMIEADVTIESTNGADRWAGLFVRQTDFNNTYYITLRSSGVLSLRKLVNGTATVLGDFAMTVTLGTTYRLRLEAVGQTLKAYVNGTQVLSAVDGTWASGRAAVGTFMAVASFDNILVTPTPLNALGWLQDNFNDGDAAGWTQIGASPWTVTSGVLTQSDTAGGNRAIRADSYWRDQSIESDVRVTGAAVSGAWAGLFVRYTDENHTYYVTLRHGENQLSLRKNVGGVITELAAMPFTVGMNTTYKVRLEATGSVLKVYVDGAPVLQATDAAFAAGRAGVGNFRASTEFDSIVVSARAPTVMSDNFEDGNADGWTPGGVQSWSVVTDGSLVYQQSDGSNGAFSIFAGGTSGSPNQTIQARVKPLSFNAPDNWVGLAARYIDANNHYYITARSPSNELQLRKTVGGVFGPLASAPLPIATGLWYKFRLEVLDTPQGATELRVYVDNSDGTGWKLLIEYTDTAPLTSGNDFGIRMFGATAEYDDVVVTTP